MPKSKDRQFVLWFDELRNTDVKYVGGKNASLGEMYRFLTPKGVRVPNGFAVTAYAYQHFVKEAGIKKEIRRVLKETNIHDVRSLMRGGKEIRELILGSQFPKEIETAIVDSYRQMEKEYGKNCDVAVRSSATAEDLPDASFAGQQDTYLNIRGATELLKASKKCVASLFTNRAISYREDKGFDHFKISLSIGVQKMVRSDKASSGVMFTIDTESGFQNVVLINSSYGLGENIVQGKVTPDEYYVFKPTLKQGYNAIVSRRLGDKRIKMIYSSDPQKPTKDVAVSRSDQLAFSITDKEVHQLAKWGVIIEKHYGRPYDMEWAKDGQTGQLFIVQARPETVMSQRDVNVLEEYTLGHRGRVLIEGTSVGFKIGTGKVRVIQSVKQIHKFQPGEVLVTTMTDPDWEPIMKIASAIVTEEGGRTSHAAIVSRELGLPAIVGTGDATKKLKTGQKVTISCAEGERGYIYQGVLPYNVKRTNIKNLQRPKTSIEMIFGTPEIAFQTAQIPNSGVGLAREEFIIASSIQIHPMALIKYPNLKDAAAKKKIEKLTAGYPNKKQYYIDKLAHGIATIAAAFHPNEVIVRLSDFKTNEYANLIGG
ncbi:MAG: phosphoenolpyruvate synthase, partial [bacterium]|nr:phosphoenolpyruvate synthase [bacterium]